MLKERTINRKNTWSWLEDREKCKFIYDKFPTDSAFWNTFWTDKPIRLVYNIPDDAVCWWFTIWDLTHLKGIGDIMDIYIPVQFILSWLSPEKFKKEKPDTSMSDYKLKYLRVYVLWQDIAQALWLPLSTYQMLKMWDITIEELDSALYEIRKKKREETKRIKAEQAMEFDDMLRSQDTYCQK